MLREDDGTAKRGLSGNGPHSEAEKSLEAVCSHKDTAYRVGFRVGILTEVCEGIKYN